MQNMATLQEIVVARLADLGLGPIEATKDAELERTFIRDIVEGKKRTVRADKIAPLAHALKLDPNALSRNESVPVDISENQSKTHKPNASFPPIFTEFPRRTIPLLGQTEGGPNGRFVMNGAEVARVFCPPELENVPNAYAVRVYGTSMEPRFMAGETVWLNPQLPVRTGDDVVVQLGPRREGDEMESYVKQFRSKSSKALKLFQHNPEEGESNELEFPADKVFSVHKIVHHSMT